MVNKRMTGIALVTIPSDVRLTIHVHSTSSFGCMSKKTTPLVMTELYELSSCPSGLAPESKIRVPLALSRLGIAQASLALRSLLHRFTQAKRTCRCVGKGKWMLQQGCRRVDKLTLKEILACRRGGRDRWIAVEVTDTAAKRQPIIAACKHIGGFFALFWNLHPLQLSFCLTTSRNCAGVTTRADVG